jgi:hypothetical protein
MQIRLHYDRERALIDPAATLQQRLEEGSGTQLRDRSVADSASQSQS